MRSVVEFAKAKRLDADVMVGTNDVLIEYVQAQMGRSATRCKEVTDGMAAPGAFLLVESPTGLNITQEKVLARVNVWDCNASLEPGSLIFRDLAEEASRLAGLKKPDKEQITNVQWRLLEGTGGVSDLSNALMEATEFLQLPPQPKPVLPWFDAQGWFRLPQVDRELRAYWAYLQGDLDLMQRLGGKEAKYQKWSLPKSKVETSIEVMGSWRTGYLSDGCARTLLMRVWLKDTKKAPAPPKKGR